MKLSKAFVKLIEDTDNDEGDALAVMIDEEDVPLEEIKAAAVEFLETIPEFEGDRYAISNYIRDNLLYDDDEDLEDDEEEEELLEDDEEEEDYE